MFARDFNALTPCPHFFGNRFHVADIKISTGTDAYQQHEQFRRIQQEFLTEDEAILRQPLRLAISPGNVQHCFCQLQVSAERIGKPHLPWCFAFRLEYLGRRDEDCHAFCPGNRDIQTVRAIEKLHTTRRIGMA